MGKTTLVEKLVARFRDEGIRVGYYKHDSHRFKMDAAGKDTARVRDSGAGIVAINDPAHFGVLADNGFKERTITHALEQCDCILIEGYKQSPFNKVVFLDVEGKLPIPADSPGIRAIVHQGTVKPERLLERGLPFFHRDEIDKIFDFVNAHFKSCASPLFGAVFVGGQSQRMGRPKFSLIYNGMSETERMTGILNRFCDRVYLSSRADLDMGPLGAIKNAGRIDDEHVQLGPVGGLATVMGRFPNNAWMITACDMPFIQEKDFEIIFEQRDPLRYGTCYVQKGRRGYEPMCAIYEPKFIVPLYEAMSRQELSLSRIIGELPFKEVRITEGDRANFMNINSPEEYEMARARREQEIKSS